MATASVNIRGYAIESVSIAERDAFNPELPPICQIAVHFAVAGHLENENEFRVELHLRFHVEGLDEPNLPYETALVLHGYFDTPIRVAPNAVPAPLTLNALMILYGVARGYIGSVTASHTLGPFVIPAIIFDDMVERAARTEGSNVVPTVQNIRPADPAAANLFRFIFAIEDLPRLAALADKDITRDGLMERIAGFADAMNRLPQSQGKAIEDCVEKLEEIRDFVSSLPPPLSVIIDSQLNYIHDGLRMAQAGNPTSRPGATAATSGAFAPATATRPRKRKASRKK